MIRRRPQLSWLRALALVLFATSAALSFSAPNPAPAPGLRLCLPESPILPYFSGDLAHPGLTERLLLDSAKALGIAVEVIRRPPIRCRRALEDGSTDVSVLAALPVNLAVADMPMRGGRLDADLRLLRVQHIVIRRRGESRLQWDGQQFQPAKPVVGVRRGIQIYQDLLSRHQITPDDAAVDGDQVLRKLMAGRIDLALLTVAEFDMLQEQAPRPLEALPALFSEVDYYLAVRRGLTAEQRALVEAWWTAISKMREMPDYRWRGQTVAR